MQAGRGGRVNKVVGRAACRPPWAVTLVVIALALAGCGNGNVSAAGEPSREGYIAAGDRLCRDFLDETEGYPEPESLEELADLLDSAIALGDETSRRLSQLRPPADGL